MRRWLQMLREGVRTSLCVFFLTSLDLLRVLTKLKTASVQQAVTIMMELGKDSGRERHG